MTEQPDFTEFIEVTGAAEHNLKGIDLQIPKRKLVVFSGVSGSGKSSLAFDTIYAEGRRRYVESLSAYARQFLGQLEKPRYDAIRGLAPTIAIEQKKATSNPRSTVGTITEISDYMRLLYARCGEQHCHECGRPAGKATPVQVVDQIVASYAGKRVTVLAPVVASRKGEFKDVLAAVAAQGFTRVRLNGQIVAVTEAKINPKKKNDLDVVVDRLTVTEEERSRLSESVETALRIGENWLRLEWDEGETRFSTDHACAHCGIGLPEASPQLFSFNSPIGMCKVCEGIGNHLAVDERKVIPDPTLSIEGGAVAPWRSVMQIDSMTYSMVQGMANAFGVSLRTAWHDLPEEVREILLHGSEKPVKLTVRTQNGSWTIERPFEGVMSRIARLYRDTNSEYSRHHYSTFMSSLPCPECGSTRLRKEARAFSVGGMSIDKVSQLPVAEAARFFAELKLEGAREVISREVTKEIRARLSFLMNVGLGYLALDRNAGTLSGGESQRIRLASQLGSELSGVIYVLDEPSIGMHPRDTGRLLDTLKRLRDLGNTVLVVEHDRETIEQADWVVEFGPGAGIHGGEITFTGTPDALACSPTITGDYLSGRKSVGKPESRRSTDLGALTLKGCRKNNLKDITVSFPLGRFIAVTGVSGAGKSSLVNETLLKAISAKLAGEPYEDTTLRDIEGLERINKVIAIDQEPIGRTPRSNPATYTKMMDGIRDVFTNTRDAKIRGYGPGRFSFNTRGGRCEACEGNGFIKVEMHFLADVYVPCEECKGKRFNRETLQVTYKGLNIYEVLELTVDEAVPLFEGYRAIHRTLRTLQRVGLGYIKLGQPSPTLSGGEAQRVKLSRELAKPATGRTLYILDEPTTGLHFDNTRMLIEVLQALVDRGNTVVVIEHNLDVVKCADWVIDLGPEGGAGGGTVLATGTPEDLTISPISLTGKFLGYALNETRTETGVIPHLFETR